MKKNLLILMTLLAAVALSGRYRRNLEAEAAEASLEKDLQVGLVELWHDPNQFVRIHQGLAEVSVSRAESHTNIEMVRFVASLHPEVPLNRVEIRCGGRLLQDVSPSAESQLETRQAQRMLDQVLGEGRSLVLVEVEPRPPIKLEMNRPGGFESNGRCYLMSYPPVPEKIRHVRLVVTRLSDRRMEGLLIDGLRLRLDERETIETSAWPCLANS